MHGEVTFGISYLTSVAKLPFHPAVITNRLWQYPINREKDKKKPQIFCSNTNLHSFAIFLFLAKIHLQYLSNIGVTI